MHYTFDTYALTLEKHNLICWVLGSIGDKKKSFGFLGQEKRERKEISQFFVRPATKTYLKSKFTSLQGLTARFKESNTRNEGKEDLFYGKYQKVLYHK